MMTVIETPIIDAHLARRAIELALRLGDAQAAQKAIYALLRHCPAAVTPLVLLSQALLDLGQVSAAVVEARQALAINALDALAWTVLAGAHTAQDEQLGARDALERATLHDPLGSAWLTPEVAHAPGALEHGVLCLHRGHPDLAVAELGVAVAEHPARHDLRVYLVEALRRCGRTSDARAQLDTIAAAQVGTLPLMLLRAALYDDRAARAQCAAYDPDGCITRRFFAPETVPWPLDPPAMLPPDAALEQVISFLPNVPAAMHTHIDIPQPVILETPIARHSLHTVTPTTIIQARGTNSVVAFRFTPTGNRMQRSARTEPSAPVTRLMISSRTALTQRYGADGWRAIDQRLHALVGTWQRKGIAGYCCYIDDAETLTCGSDTRFAPVARDAYAICQLVSTMAAAVEERGGTFGPLLIVGSDEIIPFHRLANPLADDDAAILSDNPYGCDDDGYMLPQRVVARIPTDAAHTPTFILGLLDQIIEQARDIPHKRGSLKLDTWWNKPAEPRDSLHATGYCAQAWQEPGRSVLAAFHPQAKLHTCPPLDADTFTLGALTHRHVVYANLHGAPGRANWYGQPDAQWSAATRLPVALRPHHLAGAIKHGVLISEACYGMELAGRTTATSIPLRALHEGALGCIGATVNAYGSYTTPLVGADLLCQRVLTGLARGLVLGDALFYAREEYAHAVCRRQGYLDDVDVKTLLEFVVLGDPNARVVETATRPVAQAVARFAGLERISKPRQRICVRESDLSRPLLERARAIVKHIMPHAVGAPLEISVERRQDVHAKSLASEEIIIRVQSQQPTIDDVSIPQTALITMNKRAVVKVAITR